MVISLQICQQRNSITVTVPVQTSEFNILFLCSSELGECPAVAFVAVTLLAALTMSAAQFLSCFL